MEEVKRGRFWLLAFSYQPLAISYQPIASSYQLLAKFRCSNCQYLQGYYPFDAQSFVCYIYYVVGAIHWSDAGNCNVFQIFCVVVCYFAIFREALNHKVYSIIRVGNNKFEHIIHRPLFILHQQLSQFLKVYNIHVEIFYKNSYLFRMILHKSPSICKILFDELEK